MPQLLDILAEPRRQQILEIVWIEERSAGEIAARLPVTFGAVSQHLGILQQSGLVSLRKEGRRHFYRAQKEKLGPLAAFLEGMWRDRLDHLKTLAEQMEKLQ